MTNNSESAVTKNYTAFLSAVSASPAFCKGKALSGSTIDLCKKELASFFAVAISTFNEFDTEPFWQQGFKFDRPKECWYCE